MPRLRDGGGRVSENERISKWLRECRHVLIRKGIYTQCSICKESASHNDLPPDYSNDPGAWTPELFQKIEDAGLWRKFMHHLGKITQSGTEWRDSFKENVDWAGWLIAKSAPAQKASALARAIREGA